MKRFCLILCAILMLFASAASYADVLIEPENAFYRSHRDECQHTAYRVYVTEEERIVYTAPYGMKILSKGVGTNFGIEWLYTESDGSVWGYWNDWSNAGWIEMSEMKVVYDDISFREEHGSEIVPNTDGRPFLDWITEPSAAVYVYPCGPFSYQHMGFSEEWASPECFYTDADGRLWGYVGYLYGHIDAWVCLDDPGNETLGTAQEKLLDTDYQPSRNGGFAVSAVFWVIGTVVLVSGTAAVLLVILLRRKRK